MAKTQTTNATVSTHTANAGTVDITTMPVPLEITTPTVPVDQPVHHAPVHHAVPDEVALPAFFKDLEDDVAVLVEVEREVAAIVVGGKVRVVPDETTLREMIQVGYPHAHAGQWFEAEVLAIHEHWIDVGLDVKPVGMHQQHVHAARMMKPTRVVMTGVKPYDHRGAGVQFRVYTEV